MKKTITSTGLKSVRVPMWPIQWIRRTPDGGMYATIALQRLLSTHLHTN